MDLWEGNQIRLKLGKVNVQGAFEAERRGNGRYNYHQLFVQGWAYHLVRLVDSNSHTSVSGSLISFYKYRKWLRYRRGTIYNQQRTKIKRNSTIMISGAFGSRKDSIIGFNDTGSNFWRGINGKFKFWNFPMQGFQLIVKKGTESGSSSTANGMEDQKSL
jgi:hypothetical protein